MIPVRRLARDCRIVLPESMRKQPVAGSLRFFRTVKTGMGKCEDAGSGHRPGPTRTTRRVDENSLAPVEAAFDKRNCVVNSLARNFKASISCRSQEHELPARYRQIGVDVIEVIDIAPAA